ncbi:MAG: response regulator [Desulfobacterales bacterium]|nr:response regulator [Desulfobacterales bacterium]
MIKTLEISFIPRILIIDDEKRIRDGCQKVLEQEGFEVLSAQNGTLGLQMIENEHFDIILLDLMMPGLSGFDVLEKVKSLHPDTVIIVITGYATVEHSIEAMKKGAFDFIPKPFSPDQLRIIVSKAIEHTRALKDIATEKSRMRVLINHLADGVLATDNQKKIVLANPAFFKMVGYKGEGSYVGISVEQVTQNENLNTMIDKVLSSQTFIEIVDELTEKNNGDEHETIFGVRSVPFMDRAGRNLGSVTLLSDITALKKMDKLKSDFVGMVSHEIKSPLNSVLMQIKVILDGLAGTITEKQQEILTRASEKIKSLTDLASDLLDLAKIESGLINQERESINIAALLKDQIIFHTPKAESKNIKIHLSELPSLPLIPANKRNIEEVISNLITNAIKYTITDGNIIVSSSTDDYFLCIKIEDSGIGISEEDINRIFDKFYRIKNEKTRFISGTGLGLSIVNSIIKAHNGRIRVESQINKGTTFYVYLPIIV